MVAGVNYLICAIFTIKSSVILYCFEFETNDLVGYYCFSKKQFEINSNYFNNI